MKIKDLKQGDNGLLAWLKTHKVAIEPTTLELGKVKKLGSLLHCHPMHTNRKQLIDDAMKILSSTFTEN
jgi:hypothetical protein